MLLCEKDNSQDELKQKADFYVGLFYFADFKVFIVQTSVLMPDSRNAS